MLFNSFVFIIAFFPITLILWYGLNRLQKYRIANGMLILASLVFYGYFRPSYLPIILGSILANYVFGRLLRDWRLGGVTKRLLFVVALACNLLVILYYKYWNFIAENINALGFLSITIRNIVLPLGISFFTFQQLSYVVDCYRGDAPEYPFLDYALFVCYFPQLIAGPIVTHDELVPQLISNGKTRRFNIESFSKGFFAFTLGLAKKVLIADTFGNAVNWSYQNITGLNSATALLAILAYTFQIYFDFSGYCDMATGIGYMMNIQLPMNFNSPYRALSITEFWKRWHMTLTRFFTKYVYIPLGGNRKGLARTCLNVMIVYLCSGIWHGANWTFILWGIMHGAACVLDRLTHNRTEKWHPAIRWFITFVFINVTWVYFRASSIGEANNMLMRIFVFTPGPVDNQFLNQFYLPGFEFLANLFVNEWKYHDQIIMGITIAFFIFSLWASMNMKNTNERINTFKPGVFNAVATMVLFIWAFSSLAGVSTFLYFNF